MVQWIYNVNETKRNERRIPMVRQTQTIINKKTNYFFPCYVCRDRVKSTVFHFFRHTNKRENINKIKDFSWLLLVCNVSLNCVVYALLNHSAILASSSFVIRLLIHFILCSLCFKHFFSFS